MTLRRAPLLAVAAALLATNAAQARDQFLCVADLYMALVWTEELQRWQSTSIETHAVYLVQESDAGSFEQPLYGVWRADDPQGIYVRCDPVEGETLRCDGGRFVIELTGESGRTEWVEYRFARAGTYGWSNPTSGPFLEIGRCTSLWGAAS